MIFYSTYFLRVIQRWTAQQQSHSAILIAGDFSFSAISSSRFTSLLIATSDSWNAFCNLVPFFDHRLNRIRRPAHRINHSQRLPEIEIHDVPFLASPFNLLPILYNFVNCLKIFVKHFCFQNTISFSILLIAFPNNESSFFPFHPLCFTCEIQRLGWGW